MRRPERPPRPLPPAFFLPAPERVAAALIGKLLVRTQGRRVQYLRIVETEAYGGADDEAAHAWHGLTPRTAVLFGPPGHAYIYLSYGMHWCLNVSTRPAGRAGGVLLRALEPVGQAGRAEGGEPERALSGPGRLTRALAITHALNGLDLTRSGPLYLADDGFRPKRVAVTARIGISRARSRPSRFYLPDSRCVSGRRTPVLAWIEGAGVAGLPAPPRAGDVGAQ